MANDVEREPLDISAFPDKLQKHVDPEAPTKMKMMAAQGMVPAPPAQTVRLLYQLQFDSSDMVREEVDPAIEEMPENVVTSVIEKEDHPGVLDWLGDKRGGDQAVVEQLLRNQQCQDGTVVTIGKNADAKICEVIATNEVRILRSPEIIEALYQNPNARMATVDRLIELAQRNEIELNGLPGVQRALKAKDDVFSKGRQEEDKGLDDASFSKMLQEEAEQAEQEEEKLGKLEDEDLTRSEREKLREEIEEGLEGEDDDRRAITPGVLQQMSVPEKIRLATVGSRAAIKKLVQDPNRLVHMAAIESPRIKPPDVVRMASQKSLPDGVISYIANNREWTQNYQVTKNLVFNPKTPVSDSIDLLKRLRNNELKRLQKSREVPHQVSRAAKRLYKKRAGR